MPSFLAYASRILFRLHRQIESYRIKKSSIPPYAMKYASNVDAPRVIHINGNFVIGGTTQIIVDLIERLSDQYYQQVVVCDYPEPLPYQPVLIHKFPLDKMTELKDFLMQERPDIVHIQYWVRNIHQYKDFALWYYAVFKICDDLKLTVIQNVNVPTFPYESKSVIHNVFVSKYVRNDFSHGTHVSSSVIYPGSDFHHFSNQMNPDSVDSIGMVYRLDSDKLNNDSIEIFIDVVRKRSTVKCYIIGDGGLKRHFIQRVKDEGMERNFIFTGYVSYERLPEFYKKIAIFITPVHDESFGQVTPFAMSMGLAVAGYRTGALPEILGYTDTLVEYGDIKSLSSVVLNLLQDVNLLRTLGERNKKRAHDNFSVEQMIRSYSNLYRSTVSLEPDKK